MPSSATYATLDEWISHEAIPFSLARVGSFNAAVDELVATLGDEVVLLGLGEALHGGEELLLLRNRLFQRLVEAHGYRALAIESSFSRAHLVSDYVAGRGTSYEEVQERGFSYGFGKLEANRELVEWMRRYNSAASDPTNDIALRFYGFDSPTAYGSTDCPRQLLNFALDYLTAIDPVSGQAYRARIDPLLGIVAACEDPQTMTLRVETEELIAELHIRRPELIAKSGPDRYWEAAQHAVQARQLLTSHAYVASESPDGMARKFGLRDAMMADNLAYAVSRERGRGKVLAFAHNVHLQRGMAQWQLGPDVITWWPAGAQLYTMLGPRYAVIGAAVGVSEANGIGQPEAGTLEALLTAAPGPARFIPTRRSQGLPTAALAALPVRSGSARNPEYSPLTSRSLSDYDWLAVLDSVTSAAQRQKADSR